MGRVKSSWPAEDPDWLIAADWLCSLFVLVTIGIAGRMIIGHMRNQVYPSLQRSYCIIICVPAISALNAWLGLFFPHLERFFEVAVNAYDTLSIIAFFHILVDFAGGATALTQSLKARNAALEILPFPCMCFYTKNHEAQMARWKASMYQVIAQPFWALLYAILVEFDRADKYYLSGVIHSIMFIHLTVAMLVCLAMFLDCRNDELKGVGYELKFCALKLIVFVGTVSKMVVAWYFPEEGSQTVYGFSARERSVRMLCRFRLIQMVTFMIGFTFIFGDDDPAIQRGLQNRASGAHTQDSESLMPIEGEALTAATADEFEASDRKQSTSCCG